MDKYLKPQIEICRISVWQMLCVSDNLIDPSGDGDDFEWGEIVNL